MGQTLTNGIYLPAEGERNCYEGLAANWTALDGLIGGYSVHISNTTVHVTAEDKATWNGKADASALTAHTGNTTIHVTAEDKAKWDAVTSKADASALTAHTGDTTIHVTAEDKQAWNGKADASALTAHTGDTTIHVTSTDKQAWDGHVADSVKHVTAADKAKWDAVTSKADDSDVMHLSGDESASGNKNFKGLITTTPNETLWPATTNTTADITSLGGSSIHIEYKSSGKLTDLSGGAWNVVELGEGCFFFRQNTGTDIRFKHFPTNTVNRIPVVSGTNRFINDATPNLNNTYNLGSSSLRWKTLNGLEPSSLSLPSDRSARIDISGYFTDTGTGQSNSYTVPANGYIYLTLSELTNVHCFSRSSGNVTNYAQTFTKLSNSTGALYILFPVRKNDVFVATWYTTTTVSVDGAFFIPCKGNI